MTFRAALLADGPSDLPLATHIEAMCASAGTGVAVTAIDPERLYGVGLTVEARLRYLFAHLGQFDAVFVHRDAEAQPPKFRFEEVEHAAMATRAPAPVVAVVPIRMTEAWLLLDENAIRRIAGRPNGRNPLGLPSRKAAESIADPKAVLKEALLAASETSGRRRDQFKRDFERHRRLLLEQLDPSGPVGALSAWKRLQADVHGLLQHLKNP